MCLLSAAKSSPVCAQLYPVNAALLRLTDSGALAGFMHYLSVPRYMQRRPANYTVLRAFAASLILNYNADGLAADVCGVHHHHIGMHGTVEARYGGPAGEALVRLAQQYGQEIIRPDLVLFVPESPTDRRLSAKLQLMTGSNPAFVMIVGYTFGKTDSGYHDFLSLERFVGRFRGAPVDVYVLNPHPFEVAEMLRERLHSKRVYAFPVYWNVLAWAFTLVLSGKLNAARLDCFHELTLDAHGTAIVFAERM
jgi:hypothetical protein